MNQPLPIDNIKAEFISALSNEKSIVLSAEPGAGKSTRLPLWLLADNSSIAGKIYLLQPRRLAVKSIASYLAQQLGESVGQTVGYRVRNDNKVSKNTRLEVITEGILVQIMQQDPELDGVGAVIIDEFHERSLQADLAFALARDIQQGLREDLTLLLMSATLALESLEKALPEAKFLHSTGRTFPVEVSYRPPNNLRYWRDHALTVIREQIQQSESSILVFLPGGADIRYIAENIEDLNEYIDICPLFGDLSLKAQQQAIQPSSDGRNKIVLATNIAETSLTIEGIELVIDCGLEKIAIFDEAILANKLIQRAIAKSAAIQRMGRAGRVSAGQCIRLYTQDSFERSQMQAPLAIQHADILPVVIEAARWGVDDLSQLPLIDKPSKIAELQGWQILQQLKMADHRRKLTPHGEQVVALPCHPRFAHMLITAKMLVQKQQAAGLLMLAAMLAALLEERDIINSRDVSADLHLRVQLLVKHWQSNQYALIKKQALRLFELVSPSTKFSVIHPPIEYCGALLACAYPERIAKQRGNSHEYLAANGKGMLLDEADALANNEWLVCAHLTQYANKNLIRLAAVVDLSLLIDWQLVNVEASESSYYDEGRQLIKIQQQKKLGAIVVSAKDVKSSGNSAQIIDIWQQQIDKHGLKFLNWRAEDLALLNRWRWLNIWQPQSDFPQVNEAALIDNLDLWLTPYIGEIKNKKALDQLSLSEMLFSMLDYQQRQQLKKSAPTHFVGPTGRRCAIRYNEEKHPIVSLPMQEVYGLALGPSVGSKGNEILLTLELLSPAQRPIQITSDLAGFWQGSYGAVQKEMKAKYPKHYWPDQPQNAQPTNKTKRHLKVD